MARILFVDNNPIILKQLKEMTQGKGYEVETAVNENDANIKISRREYDVVITDMKLKKDDSGVSVVKMVKKKYPLTQVIILIGYSSIHTLNVDKCMKEGAFGYVDKGQKDSWEILLSELEKALQITREAQGKEMIWHSRSTKKAKRNMIMFILRALKNLNFWSKI